MLDGGCFVELHNKFSLDISDVSMWGFLFDNKINCLTRSLDISSIRDIYDVLYKDYHKTGRRADRYRINVFSSSMSPLDFFNTCLGSSYEMKWDGSPNCKFVHKIDKFVIFFHECGFPIHVSTDEDNRKTWGFIARMCRKPDDTLRCISNTYFTALSLNRLTMHDRGYENNIKCYKYSHGLKDSRLTKNIGGYRYSDPSPTVFEGVNIDYKSFYPSLLASEKFPCSGFQIAEAAKVCRDLKRGRVTSSAILCPFQNELIEKHDCGFSYKVYVKFDAFKKRRGMLPFIYKASKHKAANKFEERNAESEFVAEYYDQNVGVFAGWFWIEEVVTMQKMYHLVGLDVVKAFSVATSPLPTAYVNYIKELYEQKESLDKNDPDRDIVKVKLNSLAGDAQQVNTHTKTERSSISRWISIEERRLLPVDCGDYLTMLGRTHIVGALYDMGLINYCRYVNTDGAIIGCGRLSREEVIDRINKYNESINIYGTLGKFEIDKEEKFLILGLNNYLKADGNGVIQKIIRPDYIAEEEEILGTSIYDFDFTRKVHRYVKLFDPRDYRAVVTTTEVTYCQYYEED